MELLSQCPATRFQVEIEMELRLCRATDLPLLEWEGLFTEHREIFEDAYRRQKRGENLMLVADARGFPVGQLWIDLLKRREHGAGYFWAFRLLPGWRNHGIGRRLLALGETMLGERGFSFAELGVETWNVDAMRFYKRLGYKVLHLGQHTTSYTTPEGTPRARQTEEWLMRKQLSPQ